MSIQYTDIVDHDYDSGKDKVQPDNLVTIINDLYEKIKYLTDRIETLENTEDMIVNSRDLYDLAETIEQL